MPWRKAATSTSSITRKNCRPRPSSNWARRLGFGQPSGVNLPGESRGIVYTPERLRKLTGRPWREADTQAMAVGQGMLTVTPLQVARMMAAMANGGLLVAPHVVRQGNPAVARPSPRCAGEYPVAGLGRSTLAAVRAGLRQAVADKEGTAHALALEQVSIAGTAGTAVIGGGQPGHAWFAGYVPADRPRYAMVVVLERAGNASTTVVPVAKRLALRMLECWQ